MGCLNKRTAQRAVNWLSSVSLHLVSAHHLQDGFLITGQELDVISLLWNLGSGAGEGLLWVLKFILDSPRLAENSFGRRSRFCNLSTTGIGVFPIEEWIFFPGSSPMAGELCLLHAASHPLSWFSLSFLAFHWLLPHLLRDPSSRSGLPPSPNPRAPEGESAWKDQSSLHWGSVPGTWMGEVWGKEDRTLEDDKRLVLGRKRHSERTLQVTFGEVKALANTCPWIKGVSICVRSVMHSTKPLG